MLRRHFLSGGFAFVTQHDDGVTAEEGRGWKTENCILEKETALKQEAAHRMDTSKASKYVV